MQDFEFSIERNILYCLQTRNGKMNAVAQVRTSVEMEKQGIITKAQALLRVAPESLEQMLFPRLDPKAKVTAVASGLPASPGAASGIAVFDADRAEMLGKEQGFKVIHVRVDQAGRHPRLLRLRGHPDLARRQDLPRGGRRPRHGQVLRGRCRGHVQ